MAHGALSQLQERHGKGGRKAAAAACGCAGDDEVHHLLPCTGNACQLMQKSMSNTLCDFGVPLGDNHAREILSGASDQVTSKPHA